MSQKIIVAREKPISTNYVVSLTPEAANCLAAIIRETGLTAKAAASTIIAQAVNNNLIEYEDKNTEGE